MPTSPDTPQQTLRFTENLRGHLDGEQCPVFLSQLRLCVDTDSRRPNGFMQARIESGYLRAEPALAEELAVVDGKFFFYLTAKNNHRTMRYEIVLRGTKTTKLYRLQGEKHLTPRRAWPWRVFDIWPDTTTVSIRLWQLDTSASKAHRLIGTGTLRIRLLAFLQQFMGIRANPELSFTARLRVLSVFLWQFTKGLCQSYWRQ